MLILTSNGLSSNKLLENTRNRISNCSKAVIVTTASVGYKENDRHIPRLISELESLNLSVDFFDFDIDNPYELLKYDIVEINGGNPFYLLKSINVSQCKDILNEIADKRVLIGISAGSIVLQKNIDLIAQYSPEMNDEVLLSDFKGLGITHLQILPHYSRFISRFASFEERAKQFEVENNCHVIRIDDGQGIFISGNVIEII